MVTMKLQNEWTWITVQENSEILLCYHTIEGRLTLTYLLHGAESFLRS